MKLTILLFITLILTGCDPGRTSIYSTQDCIENYQPTNLISITSSAQKFDSSYVELTGFYYYGFELSALSNSKSNHYESSALWVDFRPSVINSLIKDSINIHKNLSGKKIKIRGKINAKGGGHLGLYAATIRDVCFLEVYKW